MQYGSSRSVPGRAQNQAARRRLAEEADRLLAAADVALARRERLIAKVRRELAR